MKKSFYFILGGVFFFGCATAINFNYKFYHVIPTGAWDYPNGRLLGAKESDDYDLSRCKPVRKNENGQLVQECVVVFYSELNKIISEYKQTKQALIDCQRGKP
jgi:hypothetical protein